MSDDDKTNNLYVGVFEHCDEDDAGAELSGSFLLAVHAPDLANAYELFAKYMEDRALEGVVYHRTTIEFAHGSTIPSALMFDHTMVGMDETGDPEVMISHSPDMEKAESLGVRAYAIPDEDADKPFWLSEDYELQEDDEVDKTVN